MQQCPYCSQHCDKHCTMSAGGLYIPLPEHIKAFCCSPQWDQCPQYISGCEALLAMTHESRNTQMTCLRLHPRFSRRHILSLAAAGINACQPGEQFEQNAWTLDLGPGGMRIETSVALPEATKVFFTFGDDFLRPGLTGIAEVRWQREINEEGTHQYGLGFIGHGASSIIGESLMMPA